MIRLLFVGLAIVMASKAYAQDGIVLKWSKVGENRTPQYLFPLRFPLLANDSKTLAFPFELTTEDHKQESLKISPSIDEGMMIDALRRRNVR